MSKYLMFVRKYETFSLQIISNYTQRVAFLFGNLGLTLVSEQTCFGYNNQNISTRQLSKSPSTYKTNKIKITNIDMDT